MSAMQQRHYFDEYHFGQIAPGQIAPTSELFQQPNATLSGPVYVPKIYNGKNKTFFLFAVERVIEKQGKQTTTTVPDLNELAGNLGWYDPSLLRCRISPRRDSLEPPSFYCSTAPLLNCSSPDLSGLCHSHGLDLGRLRLTAIQRPD